MEKTNVMHSYFREGTTNNPYGRLLGVILNLDHIPVVKRESLCANAIRMILGILFSGKQYKAITHRYGVFGGRMHTYEEIAKFIGASSQVAYEYVQDSLRAIRSSYHFCELLRIYYYGGYTTSHKDTDQETKGMVIDLMYQTIDASQASIFDQPLDRQTYQYFAQNGDVTIANLRRQATNSPNKFRNSDAQLCLVYDILDGYYPHRGFSYHSTDEEARGYCLFIDELNGNMADSFVPAEMRACILRQIKEDCELTCEEKIILFYKYGLQRPLSNWHAESSGLNALVGDLEYDDTRIVFEEAIAKCRKVIKNTEAFNYSRTALTFKAISHPASH